MPYLKSLSSVIKAVLFSLLLLNSYSCVSNEMSKQKEITVLLGCEMSDANNDLLYSIDGIKKFTDKNHIKVIINETDKRCGYLLTWSSEKYIEGAITDYDLMMEAKSFFKLEG